METGWQCDEPTVLLPSCTDIALLLLFSLLLLVSRFRRAGGSMPCAGSEADCDGDGDVTGAAERSLTCDEVLARVGCSDVVVGFGFVGPGVPPPHRARFLEIMTARFSRPGSCHVERPVVHRSAFHCCDTPGCLFGILISCERLNPPLRNGRRHRNPCLSRRLAPLGNTPPDTPLRASRYLDYAPTQQGPWVLQQTDHL